MSEPAYPYDLVVDMPMLVGPRGPAGIDGPAATALKDAAEAAALSATLIASEKLDKASNLGDLPNKATARVNIDAAALSDEPVNPAAPPFNADRTGATNSAAAFTAAFAEAVARAQTNGGVAHVRPSPGRYLIQWDGVSGYSVNPGATSFTGINQRYCVVVNDPAVKSVVLDLTGVTLVMGGTDWTEWASFLLVKGAERHVINGTLDYAHRPFFQGTVNVVGASAISVQIDPAFGEAPSFSEVFEIVLYSEYDNTRAERYPLVLALDRHAYTGTPAPMTNQGGGLYRIFDLTPDEMAFISSTALTTGSTVVVKGCTDGPAWFNGILCPATSIVGTTCHCSAEALFLNTLCLNSTVENVRVVPRPGSNALAVVMRDAFDHFDCGGSVKVSGCEVVGTGDDGTAIIGSALISLQRVTATTMSAFSYGHYYGVAPIGSHFAIYNASHVQVAAGVITAIGGFDADYLRLYTVELSSGSLPVDMTDHIAPILEYQPLARVRGNRFRSIRGRAIYSGARGIYSDNIIENTTDEAILIHPSKGNNAANYTGGRGIEIDGNDIRGACRATFYPAAIRVFASSPAPTGSQEAALNYPYKKVSVRNNLIADCPHMAVLIAGVEQGDIFGNTMVNAAWATPAGEQTALGLSTKAVFGYINCKKVAIKRNTLIDCNGASVSVSTTANGGANIGVVVSNNADMDLATLVEAFNTDVGIGILEPLARLHAYKTSGVELLLETNSAFFPKLRMKNGSLEMSTYGASDGWYVRNETSSTNLVRFPSTGGINPSASGTYSLGALGASWSTTWTNTLSLFDGIAAPAAVAGRAQLFVDAADGDLKIIYGDGTTKTIVVDT
ncbi:hypothetical protein [Hansschlegelia sp. KR7-227]|uniref:hypothetical protein n=1 Tax=Hansschlegelia sp. KR7-227 TaxID=3400914 RepID=UPI003BFFF3CA